MSVTSVVIPTHNNVVGLRRNVQSLAKQSLKPDQVVIINYGSIGLSSLESLQKIQSEFGGDFELLVLDRPELNLNQARNAGVEVATGRLIIFLEDWIIPHVGLVEHHLAEQNRHHRFLQLTIGHLEWDNLVEPDSFHDHLLSEAGGQLFAFQQLRHYADTGYRFCYASNLAASKALLLEEQQRSAYIFDPEIDSVYGDMELGYRLEQRHVQIRYIARALGYISRPFDLSSMAEHQFQKGRAAYYIARKHPELNDSDFKLPLVLAQHRKLTANSLTILKHRIANLEDIFKIGAKNLLIHGKPVDVFLEQILGAAYNTLLQFYYIMGVGCGQAENLSLAAGEANLETYISRLIPGPTEHFTIELSPNFGLRIASDEILISTLDNRLQEIQLENNRLLEIANLYNETKEYALHVEQEYNLSLTRFNQVANNRFFRQLGKLALPKIARMLGR